MAILRRAIPLILVVPFGQVVAQCRPDKGTNEAKLLAFYTAPLAFSIIGPADQSPLGAVRLIAEAGPIPKPDPAIQKTGACFTSKSENTSLSPVFGRPRISISLPYDLTFEASYLPPVTIADATPNLVGVSLSKLLVIPALSRNANLSVRGHVTRGSVKGPITCPRSSLQTADASRPCYGAEPSRDTFRPNIAGVELTLSGWSGNGSNSGFLGVGQSWLKPRFQVGFTSGTGKVDNTRVEVDLTRTALFAGYNRRFTGSIDATAEVYSVPADVTLFRAAVSYLLF